MSDQVNNGVNGEGKVANAQLTEADVLFADVETVEAETVETADNNKATEENEEGFHGRTCAEAIKYLKGLGGTTIKRIAKNIIVDIRETYVSISANLDKPIKVILPDKGDTVTRVAFFTLFDVARIFRESNEYAFLAQHIVDKPKTAAVLLSGANLTFVQRFVTAGEIINDPFNNNEIVVSNDRYVNTLVGIELSNTVKAMIGQMMFKMMMGE